MADYSNWTHGDERYRYSTRADLPDFAAMLADPEVGRWLWFTPLPEGAVDGFFGPLIDAQQAQLAAGETPQTAVFSIDNLAGEFLGQAAIMAVEMSPAGFEIGFQLTRDAWGKGVGTRVGEFLCAYAIELCGAFRIEAGCLEGNAASIGLLTKLGLEQEGRRPGYRLKQDQRHTELCFGRRVDELDQARLRALAQELDLLPSSS